eukprot:957987-Prorocentrum_minimum.AAC.2
METGGERPSPPATGSHAGYILPPLLRPVLTLGILPPLLRLVLTLGIYCLPSCDWFSRCVYTDCLTSCDRFSRCVCTASPPATGSHAGNILPHLLRLVLTLRIYCLTSCDWFSRCVYTASPPAT